MAMQASVRTREEGRQHVALHVAVQANIDLDLLLIAYKTRWAERRMRAFSQADVAKPHMLNVSREQPATSYAGSVYTCRG